MWLQTVVILYTNQNLTYVWLYSSNKIPNIEL